MLKANVGLSRKLSKDYNSTGYSINIEGEITCPFSDDQGVIEQVKELFDVAEEALTLQIERSAGEAAIASRDAADQPQPPFVNGRPGSHGGGHSQASYQPPASNRSPANGDVELATNKQVQYLLSIAKRQRLTTQELERRIANVLGYEVGVYDLSKKGAAQVIDALTKGAESSRPVARA